MFKLQMKCGKDWVDVGEFDNISEAEFCMFDATHSYRIIDGNEQVVFKRKKTANSWRELI